MTAGSVASRSAGASLSPARRAAMLAGALALAAVGWLAWGWARDSALVQVRHVEVAGVAGPDAPQVRRALERAGAGMTTLHVRAEDLRRAVSPYASVRSLSVSTGFPSTLRITVDQREAVGVAAAGERRLAVAADGTVLPGNATGRLPALPEGAIPKDGKLAGRARLLASVLGGAPASLRPSLERIWQASDGVRIALRDGPMMRFGGPQRLRAKWAAATRLLAARATVGARVIDVRLPGRPAASFADPEPEPPAAAPAPQAPAVAPATAPAAPATAPAPVTNPQP